MSISIAGRRTVRLLQIGNQVKMTRKPCHPSSAMPYSFYYHIHTIKSFKPQILLLLLPCISSLFKARCYLRVTSLQNLVTTFLIFVNNARPHSTARSHHPCCRGPEQSERFGELSAVRGPWSGRTKWSIHYQSVPRISRPTKAELRTTAVR